MWGRLNLIEQGTQPSSPVVDPVPEICPGDDFSIIVQNPLPGHYYKVYNSSTGYTYLGVSPVGEGTISLKAPTRAATYYVVAGDSITGCESARTSVAIPVVPTVTITNATPSAVCAGSNLTLTYTTNRAGDVVWTSATTTVATVDAATGVVTGIAGGTSVITCTVTTAEGCVGSTTRTVTVNALPAVTITNASDVCAGSTRALGYSSTPAAGSVAWKSDNPTVASIAANGTVTGQSAGSSVITCTVTTAAGCTDSAQYTITVNPLPSPPAVTMVPLACRNQTFSITVDSPQTGFHYSVYSGSTGGTPLGTSPDDDGTISGITSPTSNTTYYVATVNNITGCASTRTAVPITTALTPTITITNQGTVCVGADHNLDYSVTNTTVSTVEWTSATPSVATVDPATGVVTGVAAGTSVITCTVTSDAGCTNSRTYTITVRPAPTVTITNASDVCEGATGTFGYTSSITSGVTVAWTSDNTAMATVNQNTGAVRGIAAGTANITCTVTVTATGCTGSATYEVTVNPKPTVTITNQGSACIGSTRTLGYSSDPAASSVAWKSSAAGVAKVDATTGVVTGVASGTATITCTVTTASGCTGNATYLITVGSVCLEDDYVTVACNNVSSVINILGNDNISCASPGVNIVYQSTANTATLNGSNEIVYTGNSADTVIYSVDCGGGNHGEATVYITASAAGSAFVDDVWYYGMNTQGIRFTNSGGVYSATDAFGESKVDSHENSLVVSSPYCDGEVIFYASHNRLYNSFHQPMSNGSFMGHRSVADGLAACYMGDNKYLFFSVTNANEIKYDGVDGKKGLKAYVVDMNADHGRGAIADSIEAVVPNVHMSESIELVAAGEPHKYWLIYAYNHQLHVRTVDVSLYPDDKLNIVSTADTMTVATSTTAVTYTLKVSPQHDRIAIANSTAKTVDVFDFNNVTGKLSNLRTTAHAIDGAAYGIEFSPDGAQLYAAGYTVAEGNPVLCQYTIPSTGPLGFVEEVKYWTYTASGLGDDHARGGGLKLGPDGKIYVVLSYDSHVGIISEPNNTTPLANGRYNPAGMNLGTLAGNAYSYALQFSTGLTRPSEMECNTNEAPVAHAVDAVLCLAQGLQTVAVNVVANVTDEDHNAIYLTGAKFVYAADTTLAYLTVNPEDSTVRLTVKPDVSLAADHAFRIIYHVKDNGSPASQCATAKLTVKAYPNPNYPDIRIRICPDAGKSVNLSKYLDTITANSVIWTSVAPHIPIDASTGTILTNDVKTFGVHTFTYTVDNYCATNITRKVYLEPLKPDRMRPLKDSVVICYLYAEALQLNQLFGVEAYGTWSFDAGSDNITPYITESTSPAHNGAVIMNGKAIYNAFSVGGAPKRVKVTYTPANNSCLAGKTFSITIILTGT